MQTLMAKVHFQIDESVRRPSPIAIVIGFETSERECERAASDEWC